VGLSSGRSALVSGSLRSPEGLREPAAEWTRRVAGASRPGSETAIHASLWFARQPRGDQREQKKKDADGDDADDEHCDSLVD
jgi:hypothetical protein